MTRETRQEEPEEPELDQLRAEHRGYRIVSTDDGRVRAERKDDPGVQMTRASVAGLGVALRVSRRRP